MDGTIDPGTLTNSDALQIFVGANQDTQMKAWDYWYDENDTRAWYDGLSDVVLHDEPELVELLATSNVKQQLTAEQLRAAAIDDGTNFASMLGAATRKLKIAGLFNDKQMLAIDAWLIALDEQPYMQYTPMSQLEYARLALKCDKNEIGINSTDCTDFSFGIIRSAVRAYGQSAAITGHNKVHESVHGSLSGVEIYDITHEDGWRRPAATVVGEFASEPVTDIVADDDFGSVKNAELSEGWTDFITRELIRAEPSLRKVLPKAEGYAAWAQVVGDIHRKSPDVYDVVTNAMMVEATPHQPDAKRIALSEMYQYADRKLGTSNALYQLFIANGGSILDLYAKGKSKKS